MRSLDAARWVFFINISNASFQYHAISEPQSDEHLRVNLIYTINTIIIFILLIVSKLKKNLLIPTTYAAMVLLLLRQCIRIFDFENTRMTDVEGWNRVLLLQLNATFFSLTIQSICFYNTRFQYLFILGVIFLTLFAFVHQFKEDHIMKDYITRLLYFVLVWGYQIYVINKIVKNALETMNEESEQKNQFRLILQNIMEPIIIVSKNGIEVVNE